MGLYGTNSITLPHKNITLLNKNITLPHKNTTLAHMVDGAIVFCFSHYGENGKQC